MRLVIEQDDSQPHYKHQKGFTYQLNDGPVEKAAKSSVIAQFTRCLLRLIEISDKVEDPRWTR